MIYSTTTMRPGFLIGLKTAIKGNVSYIKTDIARDITENGTTIDKWETLRLITDAEELEQAKKTRSKVTSLLRSVCAQTAFGMLCPSTKEDDLKEVVRQARQLAASFNVSASNTRVEVAVMVGKIASDDVEAVRAINSEVRDLLQDMRDGVQALDPKMIRAAADKARQLGTMLEPGAAGRVKTAIDAARAAAKDIVKAGEQAVVPVDQAVLDKIADMRTAFLDMEDAGPIAAPEAEAGHAIELAPAEVTYDANLTERAALLDRVAELEM